MKKIYNILFVIALFMTFNLSVKADTYYCAYTTVDAKGTSGGDKTYTGSLEIDKTNLTITALYSESYNNVSQTIEILDPLIKDSSYNEESIVQVLTSNGTDLCPKSVKVCTNITEIDRGIIINKGLWEYADEVAKSKGQKKYTLSDGKELKTEKCYEAEIDYEWYRANTVTKPNVDDNGLSYCVTYNNYFSQLKKYNSDDCKNSSSCEEDRVNNYNVLKENLKEYCKQKLGSGNYYDPCVVQCMNLESEIYALEGKGGASGNCGFSDRLIAFIVNILKWIKYLVPALIIILSIIDFMKAIGADKDDEMKKAQQKFMKRLIIAALIFIVPFILEFVITKMGFNYNSCGIF